MTSAPDELTSLKHDRYSGLPAMKVRGLAHGDGRGHLSRQAAFE